MLEFLNTLDTALFFFLNRDLANPVFDFIMPIITNRKTWYPIWLVAMIGLIWKGGKRGRWTVLLAILAVGLTDPLVARVLKPLFERIRPCNALENVHLLVRKSRSFSLPSAHAANFFAAATVFSYFYRKYQWLFWGVAFIVAYSRIAVGVHYPFDVMFGALFGTLISALWILVLRKKIKP